MDPITPITAKFPDLLGIPSVIASIAIGFINFIQGNFFGGMLSLIVTIMSAVYLYFKIKGQQLDNEKKKLKLTV